MCWAGLLECSWTGRNAGERERKKERKRKKKNCVRWGSNPRLRRDHHLKVAPWTARPRTRHACFFTTSTHRTSGQAIDNHGNTTPLLLQSLKESRISAFYPWKQRMITAIIFVHFLSSTRWNTEWKTKIKSEYSLLERPDIFMKYSNWCFHWPAKQVQKYNKQRRGDN